MSCTACGSQLPEGARFCPQCGAKVEIGTGGALGAAPSETVAPADRSAGPAVPAETSERHERRILTVLFADLVGFTAASDGADPEDVRARVRPFHALVRRAVAETGGTVARVVGDGVMAVWGYPIAREDDAIRAIRASLAILEGLPASGRDLHARIGINTGEAVVAFGSAEEDADDAMGDAVNVAARLAAAATPDSILVGETTRLLAGDRLECDVVPPLTLKGKAEPVAAVRVRALRSDAPPRSATAFVGRAVEVGRLVGLTEEALDSRRVRRACVVGEPGIGKSRLLAEARARTSTTGKVAWHVGRCRQDATSPGWALGEIVKSIAGIADDDAPETVAAKLGTIVIAAESERDRGWIVDSLRPLVGLDPLAPTGAEELIAGWTAFLISVGRQTPSAIVFEDVHWADRELVSLLGRRELATADVPLTILATGRPEALVDHPELQGVDLVLRLDPLSGDDLDGLVSATAGKLRLGPRERAAIVARGGGNPLFTSELVRLVAQRGPSAGHERLDLLPDTVQAVIAARLDLLPTDVRDVARDAAVVGATFWPAALTAIDGSKASRVDGALAQLVGLELIRPRSETTLPAMTEYAFRHVLVRDVAYGQLTRAARAVRHAAVGRWLGEVAGDDRGDLAGIVADHDLLALELAHATEGEIDLAALRSHALRHLILAGRQARTVDPSIAARRYAAAVELADTDALLLGCLLHLAESLDDAGDYPAELATIDRGLDLAARLGDRETEARLLILASNARRSSDVPGWMDAATKAVDILRPLPPTAALVDAYAQLSWVEVIEGTAAGAIAAATAAIDLALELGIEPPANAYVRRGLARVMYGELDGMGDIETGARLAESGQAGAALSRILSDRGGAAIYFGRLHDGEADFRAAADLARRRGIASLTATGEMNVGHALNAEGRWDEALRILRATRDDLDRGHDMIGKFLVRLEMAFIEAERGSSVTVHDLHAELVALASEGREHYYAEYLPFSGCLVAAATGDRDAFVNWGMRVSLQPAEGDFDGRMAVFYPPIARGAVTCAAAEVIERIIPTVATFTPLGSQTRTVLEAYAAAARGEHGPAAAALEAAAATYGGWGYVPESAHATQAAATCLLALGHAREAAALLHLVRPTWERLGARPALARCDELLARADGSSPAPPRAAARSRTP